MKCPNDQTTLLMSDRSGIEIDYCPECRGVWLDRGELDKLIERSVPTQSPTPPPQASYGRQAYDERRYTKGHYDGDYHKHHYKKKPKSPLAELFDF